MQYCGNAIGQKFLDNLVREIADWNEVNKSNPNTYEAPVSFYVAALWNQFKFHSEKYAEFFDDVKDKYSYQIIPNEYGDVYMVNLWNENDPNHRQDIWLDEQMIFPELKNYHYEIHFSYDERYLGYCECQPGDEDYNEDYQCCGHGCDWDAPTVTVYKCYDVDDGVWNGDEHDYWDFEDAFYKDDLELKARIEEEAKRQRIKELEKQIASYQNDLDMLKKEMNDDESV